MIYFSIAAGWFIAEVVTCCEEGDSLSFAMVVRCLWFGLICPLRCCEWLLRAWRGEGHAFYPVNSWFWWNTPALQAGAADAWVEHEPNDDDLGEVGEDPSAPKVSDLPEVHLTRKLPIPNSFRETQRRYRDTVQLRPANSD